MKELSLLSTCLWRAKGHIYYLSYFIWFFLYKGPFFLYKGPTPFSMYFGFIRKNNHTHICLYSMSFIPASDPQQMSPGTGPLKSHQLLWFIPASALLHFLLMKMNSGSQLYQSYCAWLQALARSPHFCNCVVCQIPFEETEGKNRKAVVVVLQTNLRQATASIHDLQAEKVCFSRKSP